MEYFPLILLLFLLLAMIARLLTVFIHEMGHAIPAALLTKQKVIVYIGSYGDGAKSILIKAGLLEIWLKYNPFRWTSGLCIPTAEDVSVNKRIIYIISGPVASLVIAALACYFTFSFDLHGSLKLFFIVLLGSAVFDLLHNLLPRSTPIILHNNTITYNDGRLLQELFGYIRFPKAYMKAVALYERKKYKEALTLFEDFLKRGFDAEEIYRLGISCCITLEKYDRALALHMLLEENHPLTADDYCMSGTAKGFLSMYEASLGDFEKSLAIDAGNVYTLNNRGYLLNNWERYNEAIPDFDLAISLNADFPFPYNNRGLAKIKTGRIEEGLQDILRSLEIDPDNSYAYRNLGIYHMDQGEKNVALELFLKAKTLDAHTDQISELIKKVC